MTAQPTRDQLRALADAATPGPWETYMVPPERNRAAYVAVEAGDTEIRIARYEGGHFDGAFIAAAREAVPELLDQLADAEKRATRAEAQSTIRGRAVTIYQRRAREAEAEARTQRHRADDMEDNALRTQTNLRAAEERVDEWRQAALEESAAQPRPLMHETPPAITLSRIRQLTYNAKRRNETIRPDQILAILERRKA